MPYLDIFGLKFQKGIVIFEINTLEYFLKQSFEWKWKSLNLGPAMPYLGVLGSDFEKVLSYLKLAPSNLSKCKISSINKDA